MNSAPVSPGASRSHVALHAALINAALIVFLSAYPFTGWRDTGLPLFDFLFYPLPYYTRFFDNAVNLLIYIPYGFSLALVPHRKWQGWALAMVVASVSSVLVETLQQFLPLRVASNLDVLYNTGGAACGATLATFPLFSRFWAQGKALRRRWFVGDSSADYALLLIGLWFLTQLNPAIPLFGMVVLPEGLPQPYISPLQDPQLFLMLIEGGSAMLNLAGSLLFLTCFLSRRQYQLRAIAYFLLTVIVLKLVTAGALLKPALFFQWVNLNVALGLLGGLLLVWVVTRGQRWPQTVGAMLCLLLSQLVVSFWPLSGLQSDVLSLFRWSYGHLLNMSALVDLVADLWPLAAFACLLLSLRQQGRR
ncbi:VanZ family protein [Vogesella fluminis]|uniref:VanZ-like domain-containing protein n=1 Tax=Vogesella fluminis TaxID=1069161 RepID=A0ABQ3HBA0_9NEIS|nr:VanZ family protein [Vogesella fluminis]GHD80192.1 hypothetical protein GCM10011419_24540 [Vogesella fluminis]